MAISYTNSRRLNPSQMVASTTKLSIIEDVENLRDRLLKALKGDIKFLDAKQREVSEALRMLSGVSGLLTVGLIPTNTE